MVLILLFTFFQLYSVVSRDTKVHNIAGSLSLSLVVWPWWCIWNDPEGLTKENNWSKILEDERRPSKLQYWWGWPEYWEEAWILEEIRHCSGSNSGVQKLQGVRFGSWRPSGDHPNNSIIENGQNTEKSSGDLRRLAVTQSPAKDYQRTLMWKTLMSKL